MYISITMDHYLINQETSLYPTLRRSVLKLKFISKLRINGKTGVDKSRMLRSLCLLEAHTQEEGVKYKVLGIPRQSEGFSVAFLSV